MPQSAQTVVGGGLEFGILGPLEARRDGEQIALGGAKQRALLARLLLQPGEPLPVDRLIEDLWGAAEAPSGAAHTLQVYVSSLRKVLGKDVVQHQAGGYLAAVEPDCIDAHRFERLRIEAAAQEPREAQRLIGEALALWRGPALADFRYESFAQGAIARLEEGRASAIEDRIDADLALGAGTELVAELQELLTEHPLRERLRGQLMVALYRAGRQSDALAEFQAARARLVDELGIDPSPQLQELHRAILNQDDSLLATEPEAPQLRLPAPLTPLVGRDCELEDLVALLVDRSARLITLTGPGGTGKTRLALAFAERIGRTFPDGAVFVGLASVSRPELVHDAIEQEVCPGALEDHLRDRRLLLVLDNFEQVADAAVVVARLLEGAPELTVVVTSRVSLHLSSEIEYPVPPLEEGEAVELFAERAAAAGSVVSSNGAVTEICRRLDCLPLALELAAARTKLLPPDALLHRLEERLPLLTGGPRDAPERHRTLRATIEWSHALLEPEEQRVFAALSVFVGGCTVEAAEEVCEADLDTLASLVDKSLVRAGGGRFRMLETIREFASEQLSERPGVERVGRRHAEHFARFMSEAAPEFEGSHQAETFAAVQREQWNVRSALRSAIDHGDAALALTLAAPIGRYWFLREQFSNRSLLEEAIALGGDEALRSAVLLRIGELAGYAGDRERALEALEECIELRRRIGDRRGTALGLNSLGITYAMGDRDDLARAREVLSERLALSRELGDEVGVASALCNLGAVEGLLDAPERARPLLEEALEIAERFGHDYGRAVTSISLGTTLADLGEYELAWERLRDALLLLRQLNLQAGALEALGSIALLAVTAGDVATAGRLLGAVEAARAESGGASGAIQTRTEWTRARAAELDPETFERALAEGQSLSIEAAIDEALAATHTPVHVDSGV